MHVRMCVCGGGGGRNIEWARGYTAVVSSTGVNPEVQGRYAKMTRRMKQEHLLFLIPYICDMHNRRLQQQLF